MSEPIPPGTLDMLILQTPTRLEELHSDTSRVTVIGVVADVREVGLDKKVVRSD